MATSKENKTKQRGGTSIGYGELLRTNRRFRLLWMRQVVSLFGDWFNLIASASLIAIFTGSGLAVGSLFVVRMLSHFIASPAAGVAADRANRKHLLVAADLIHAVVVLGFLLVREPSMIWLLYALTVVQMATSGFFYTGRNAILPDLVEARAVGTANALSAATWSVMLAFGAAAGGAVTGLFGTDTAFIIDAASFLLSALLISRIPYESEHAPGEKTIRGALREYVEGLVYLWEHRDILAISVNKAASALFLGASLRVIHVAIADSVFTIGAAGGLTLGLLFAAQGTGTGLGPIVARRLTGDRDLALRIAMVAGYGIGAVGLLISAPLASLGLVLVGAVVAGAGGGLAWVFSTQLLLQNVPNKVRGRVFGTEFALFTLGNAAGAGLIGLALDANVPIGDALSMMGVFVLLPGTYWGVLTWRKWSSS